MPGVFLIGSTSHSRRSPLSSPTQFDQHFLERYGVDRISIPLSDICVFYPQSGGRTHSLL